jgi:hypothetical protein
MRFTVLCSLVFLSAASPLGAQSLDIGGIEVRIGQPIELALSQLRVAYNLKYEDNVKRWFVSRQDGSVDVSLGQVGVADGIVNFIAKEYKIDVYRLDAVYTAAMHDTQRRGGTTCTTFPSESENVIHSIETVCGRYRLGFTLPFTIPAMQYGGGIQLYVAAQP